MTLFSATKTYAQNTTKPSYLFNYIRYINKNILKYGFNIVNSSFISYRLVTRELNGTYILISDSNLTSQNYIKTENPFKILIHGYTDTANVYYYGDMTREYLIKGDINVIQVDWSRLANSFYPVVAGNSRDVGRNIALFLIALNKTLGLNFESFYLIGPSVGKLI